MTAERCLILIAHGSRRGEANREVAELTDRLRQRLTGRFDRVSHAFLELAEPDIPGALQGCLDEGARQIDILPYFLAAGRHVAEDIPEAVRAKQADRPDVTFRILPYLGATDGLLGLLADIPDRAGGGAVR